MSNYNRTFWKDSPETEITAERLNNMEEGISTANEAVLKLEKDYIVEQGTSGIWTYRKWASGIAECWGTTDIYTCSTLETWGSLYAIDNIIPPIAFPFEFIEVPTVTICPIHIDGYYWTYSESNKTTTHSPYVSVARPTNIRFNVQVDFQVKGRWK